MSQLAIKRIVRDVRHIQQNPLDAHHIYYLHNEENVMEGHAMIIGPENTPYFGGFYFFKFTFPNDYPFSPPNVTFLTNDGTTRFNPNLYTNGRVCVSILNTWSGERWSPCQTISSVLLAICTLLTANPLLNEPGITNSNECVRYANLIHYKNLEFAVCTMLENETDGCAKLFYGNMVDFFLKNTERLMLNAEKENETICLTVYSSLRLTTDYEQVRRRLAALKTKLYDATPSEETKDESI